MTTRVAESTSTTAIQPSSTTSTTEPYLPMTEDEAARAFVAAWARRDRTAMAAIARPDDLVDQALDLGTPTGSIDRVFVVGYAGADPEPQVQAVLPLTNGRRAYLVMIGPGTGVNWVADYVEDEGGTDGPP